jgi:hypothetical protein
VIGGDMQGGYFVSAFRLDGSDQSIRIGRQAIVGCENEKRHLTEPCYGVFHAEGFGIGSHFVGHAFGSDTGQRFHVVGH